MKRMLRTWESLAKEYGVSDLGHIYLPSGTVSSYMKPYLGKMVTITRTSKLINPEELKKQYRVDEWGVITISPIFVSIEMKPYLGKMVTATSYGKLYGHELYKIKEDLGVNWWSEDCFKKSYVIKFI